MLLQDARRGKRRGVGRCTPCLCPHHQRLNRSPRGNQRGLTPRVAWSRSWQQPEHPLFTPLWLPRISSEAPDIVLGDREIMGHSCALRAGSWAGRRRPSPGASGYSRALGALGIRPLSLRPGAARGKVAQQESLARRPFPGGFLAIKSQTPAEVLTLSKYTFPRPRLPLLGALCMLRPRLAHAQSWRSLELGVGESSSLWPALCHPPTPSPSFAFSGLWMLFFFLLCPGNTAHW